MTEWCNTPDIGGLCSAAGPDCDRMITVRPGTITQDTDLEVGDDATLYCYREGVVVQVIPRDWPRPVRWAPDDEIWWYWAVHPDAACQSAQVVTQSAGWSGTGYTTVAAGYDS